MTITEIKKKIRPILIRNNVKKAAIFGSFARGDNTKRSDIDILIEYEKENKSLFDFIGLKIELEKKLGKKVDLVEYSMLKQRIKERVLAEQHFVL